MYDFINMHHSNSIMYVNNLAKKIILIEDALKGFEVCFINVKTKF